MYIGPYKNPNIKPGINLIKTKNINSIFPDIFTGKKKTNNVNCLFKLGNTRNDIIPKIALHPNPIE